MSSGTVRGLCANGKLKAIVWGPSRASALSTVASLLCLALHEEGQKTAEAMWTLLSAGKAQRKPRGLFLLWRNGGRSRAHTETLFHRMETPSIPMLQSNAGPLPRPSCFKFLDLFLDTALVWRQSLWCLPPGTCFDQSACPSLWLASLLPEPAQGLGWGRTREVSRKQVVPSFPLFTCVTHLSGACDASELDSH